MSVQSQQNTPNKQQQPGQQYGNKSAQQNPPKTGQQYGNGATQSSVGNGVADKEKSAGSNGSINMGRDPGTPGQNPEDKDNVWKDGRKADTNKSDPSCGSSKKDNAA